MLGLKLNHVSKRATAVENIQSITKFLTLEGLNVAVDILLTVFCNAP